MLVLALGRQGQEEPWACLATHASLMAGFQSSEPLSQPKMMSEERHLELTSGFHMYMCMCTQHTCVCTYTCIHTQPKKKNIFLGGTSMSGQLFQTVSCLLVAQ